MFDYRRLYQTKDRLQWFVQSYCAGMAHICRVTDGSNLNTVKTDLGLAGLERVVTGLPQFGQVLYASDAFGAQFHVGLTGDIKDAWYQCMQIGLDSVTGLAGKTFRIINTWADALVTIVNTKVTADTDIFCAGHGLGGAVAALAALKLKKAGKKSQQCYLTGSVGFLTDAMLVEYGGDGTTPPPMPAWWMGLPEDELCWAPPSGLFFAKYTGTDAQILAEVFAPGIGQNWARSGRPRVSLHDLIDLNDPLGWPSRIPDTMANAHATDNYVRTMRRWTVNNETTRGYLKELIDTLNTNYAFGLPPLGV